MMTGDLAEVTKVLDDVSDILELALADPLAAADQLDVWAEQLHAMADQLRAGAPLNSREGFGDRVTVRVVGPDGRAKATGHSNN